MLLLWDNTYSRSQEHISDLVNVNTNAGVVIDIKRVDNNIPFSLHDSRIIKISAEAGVLL